MPACLQLTDPARRDSHGFPQLHINAAEILTFLRGRALETHGRRAQRVDRPLHKRATHPIHAGDAAVKKQLLVLEITFIMLI